MSRVGAKRKAPSPKAPYPYYSKTMPNWRQAKINKNIFPRFLVSDAVGAQLSEESNLDK